MALKPKEHFHGSDLEKIEAVYGIKKEDIISFSANVNPLGVSFRLKETLTNHIDATTITTRAAGGEIDYDSQIGRASCRERV